MNDITDHIKKAADHVHLSEAERRDLSYVVREYMAHKPLPVGRQASPHGAYSSISIHWFSFSWIHRPLPAVRQGLAAALALVFIFGGGISYAAEGALPGDALYSVKTKVNESVKVALATDTEARANVQMELAERRIEEAAVLAAENRLDAETETELAAAFEAHASNATQEVATIDEDDSSAAAEMTSRFETRLAAHEEILSMVSEADATNTLASAIRGAGLAVADIRARAEERMSVSAPAIAATLAMEATPASDTMAMKAAAPSVPEARTVQMEAADVATDKQSAKYDSRAAERMRASAEAQLKVAQKKLKSSKASAEVRAQAEADLALAGNRIEEGRTFLKDKANAQAYHAFQQSLVISEKMNVMLKSKTALKKASARAADARANTRAKKEELREESRATNSEEVHSEATIQATATPIDLEVETEVGTTVHEVVPVIPPPLRIFKKDDHNEDRDEDEEEHEDLINIGL